VAAGGGLGLATSFDIRYVGPEARFLTVFSRRALAPDCGLTYFLPRLVGPAKALELLYTSDEIGAEQAVALGLANSLHDDPDAKAWEVARALAQGPPLSYMWSKRDVQHSWAATVQGQIQFEWAGQGQASRSDDVQEGRRAFLEKRAPQFEGR
jgi:2-(1,2-epoxy-1,2-dihydrophenyl)acetyl-CoA isomerase